MKHMIHKFEMHMVLPSTRHEQNKKNMFYELKILIFSPFITWIMPLVSLYLAKYWSPFDRENSGSRAAAFLPLTELFWRNSRNVGPSLLCSPLTTWVSSYTDHIHTVRDATTYNWSVRFSYLIISKKSVPFFHYVFSCWRNLNIGCNPLAFACPRLTGFCPPAAALSSTSAGQLNMCSESQRQFCLDWNSL